MLPIVIVFEVEFHIKLFRAFLFANKPLLVTPGNKVVPHSPD
jgi:hypothetical protein